jgi:hypothetical protein
MLKKVLFTGIDGTDEASFAPTIVFFFKIMREKNFVKFHAVKKRICREI